ncbi:MAG: Zn-dependent hydrolase including glyoxylase [Conexibacter sp.]|nr:Zn-dependent hydrolase including glyoxylase [Conexibacter sp.]
MLQRDVAPGIHRIEDAYVNWYLVEVEGRFTIVDAGVPTSWASLQDALRQLDVAPDRIDALVLTHAHFDHIGFAERARSELGIPVWVHEDDVPLTRHPLQYTRERNPLLYLLRPQTLPITVAFLRNRAFFPAPIAEVRPYGDEGTLAVPGSPQIVYTPGHTIGHCSLHFPERDVVIAGDALVTFNPYTNETGPQLVARAATADSDRALRSLDALAATAATVLLPGHGAPWMGGVEAAVAQARAAGVK